MINPPGYELGNQWIISQRGERNEVDSSKPYLYFKEKEFIAPGKSEDVNTIFLTNSECPFKCLMCDLWKNTTETGVNPGDISSQIKWANKKLGSAKHVKLYNSGNFFDQRAIPVEDYESIADLIAGYETVIVESHPKLIGELSLHFNDLIHGRLQVAIGLETVHPEVLPLLNKKMDLKEFGVSVKFLKKHAIDSRAFILLKPPFLSEAEGIEWAKRSIDFAFDSGVECCVVIPTRVGNGALDHLQSEGYFASPGIESLEEVLAYGIGLKAGRVFGDLWDIHKFSNCSECFEARISGIQKMNTSQNIQSKVNCSGCN